MIYQIIYVGITLFTRLIFECWEGILFILRHQIGHLIGFVFAAFIIGSIVQKKDKDIITTFVASLLGLMSIYILVITSSYYIFIFYSGESISFWKQFALSEAIRFLPGGLVTCFFTGLAEPKLASILREYQLI